MLEKVRHKNTKNKQNKLQVPGKKEKCKHMEKKRKKGEVRLWQEKIKV